MPRTYQRAIITGATSGIGAAFAMELPDSTDLLLTGRNLERLGRMQARLSRSGRVIEIVVADLAQQNDIDRLSEAALSFAGDLLINNAGAGQLGKFLDNPEETERATAMVNVVAVVTLTRRLLPAMRERARAGRRHAGLIVLSSLAAFSPVPLFATYAASKTFGLCFAEALADEMKADPVDVLAVCPGATQTSFGKRAGYHRDSFPGAADPRAVARGALAALGHETVYIPGVINQAAFGPLVMPRRMVAGAVGTAMRLFMPRSR